MSFRVWRRVRPVTGVTLNPSKPLPRCPSARRLEIHHAGLDCRLSVAPSRGRGLKLGVLEAGREVVGHRWPVLVIFDFRFFRHPRSLSESDLAAVNISNEIKAAKHPTKSPEVNRSGEYRPGENGYRLCRNGRSGVPLGYNPRKQREIPTQPTSVEWVVSGGWRRGGNWGRVFSGP